MAAWMALICRLSNCGLGSCFPDVRLSNGGRPLRFRTCGVNPPPTINRELRPYPPVFRALSLHQIFPNPLCECGLIDFAGCDGQHRGYTLNIIGDEFESIQREKQLERNKLVGAGTLKKNWRGAAFGEYFFLQRFPVASPAKKLGPCRRIGMAFSGRRACSANFPLYP